MANTLGSDLAESARPAHPPGVPKWVNWAGGVITALVSLAFVASGVAKLTGGPEMAKSVEPLGLPADLLMPLGIFEVVCVLLYLAPATSILAAILFTGYLGGAILAHARVREQFVAQVIIGVLVWLGVFFRDYRLRQLIPLRRGPDKAAKP